MFELRNMFFESYPDKMKTDILNSLNELEDSLKKIKK